MGSVHIDPRISLPVAVLLALFGLWLLRRPTRAGTPRSRTRIRALSMWVRLMLLVPFVIGVSFVDPHRQPLSYVSTWGVAAGLLGLSFLITLAEVLNNRRLRAERAQRLQRELFGTESPSDVEG